MMSIAGSDDLKNPTAQEFDLKDLGYCVTTIGIGGGVGVIGFMKSRVIWQLIGGGTFIYSLFLHFACFVIHQHKFF